MACIALLQRGGGVLGGAGWERLTDFHVSSLQEPRSPSGAFCCPVNSEQPKTPEQCPRVMDQSRTFQWLVVVEAAGVGTWGRTFQV